uniref:leukocyte immunoglobulin-like receptor subfamily B member 2 n=1 Tax=Ictidomys tridecemlineatus TaxID=43179 RepID=UPI00038C3E8D|nr:leukocyte immunoglobulin-like receptor subfamily B member 2 [Ictidomys tridecemlineatus]
MQDGPVSSLASFTLNAVTLVHGGTSRCYGSHSATPYLLSQPREPLELGVSASPLKPTRDLPGEEQPAEVGGRQPSPHLPPTPGGPEDQPLSPTDPGPQSGE